MTQTDKDAKVQTQLLLIWGQNDMISQGHTGSMAERIIMCIYRESQMVRAEEGGSESKSRRAWQRGRGPSSIRACA